MTYDTTVGLGTMEKVLRELEQLGIGGHQQLQRRVGIEASNRGQGALESVHPLAGRIVVLL